jgi:hypothetical protein
MCPVRRFETVEDAIQTAEAYIKRCEAAEKVATLEGLARYMGYTSKHKMLYDTAPIMAEAIEGIKDIMIAYRLEKGLSRQHDASLVKYDLERGCLRAKEDVRTDNGVLRIEVINPSDISHD